MSKDDFLRELKNDINNLIPYKNNYTMSDILAIKQAYNDLILNNKAVTYCFNVMRFYDRKKYNNNIITFKHNGFYVIMF